jgi:hypothetical protein
MRALSVWDMGHFKKRDRRKTVSRAGVSTSSFLLLLVGIVVLTNPVFAQPGSTVLAPGSPPLTQLMVDKSVALIKWSLQISISDENKAKLQNLMVQAWKIRNMGEIKSTLDIIDIHDKLMAMGESERNAARPTLQSAILENLRKDPNDEMSRIIVDAFNEARAGGPNPAAPAARSRGSGLRVGQDGFTGVYRMVRPRAISINNSGYEPGYWIEYITFLPDGHVYWRLPPEGLLHFDPVIAQRAYPDDWGTYEFKNGEIHILRGPQRRPYVITRSGDRLNNPPSLGKGSFRPIPSADGLRLDGTYHRSETEPKITFTTDGRFQESGIFRYFGTAQRPDGSIYQDDGKGGSGTYVIEQNTLELKYSDGRIKRVPFIIFPENLAKKPAVDGFILRYEEQMKRL